jgi:diguanylate cyclase (GGDEF)-like protein
MSAAEGPGRPALLIVDDDRVMRMLAREALSPFGFDIREAEDGERAIEMMREIAPDLVLLDVDMPGIDGYEVCRRVRERWDAAQVPVIMVTAMDDVDSINRAYETGANDFIAKPLNWSILGHRARYVTRASQSARNLRALEQRQAAIVRAMPDMIFLLDRHGTYLDYTAGSGNRPFADPRAFLGRRIDEILPADVATLIQRCIELALERKELQSAFYELPMAGGVRHYEARVAPSGPDTVIALVRDITSQRNSEERIRHLAYFDTLTGMPNRQHFIEQARGELARADREGRRLALLYLDLDGFKRINDTLGHSEGDYLLRSVSRRMKDSLRRSDLLPRPDGEPDLHLARLGGDEFTVLLPDIGDPGAATAIADRVKELLGRPFPVDGRMITITASIGISVFPEDGRDVETLLKHADTAMYHAKATGRNNWQMYSRTLTTRAMADLSLESDLRKALERGEFRLLYQPQVDSRSGRITGCEALIRWQHPERGLLMPGDFVAFAEEVGLIVPIGAWVLRSACGQARTWMLKGLHVPRLAVNLSARQLRAPSFFADVATVIAENGIDADMLELELTESMLMDPDAVQLEELGRLRALGVHFSIDDFGTGYSSMSYIKRFPIGRLKIDRSFVRGLPGSANDAGITTAILAMARSLDLCVVAEGVETREQYAFLREARCPNLQGYLFSQPVPTDTMESLLRGGSIDAGLPKRAVARKAALPASPRANAFPSA